MNNNLSISLADYGVSGPGQMAVADLDVLQKSLEATQLTGRDTTNLTNASGAPLKVESLENTLKILTFKEQDIQFWKRIPKLPAYNTVEEFNELSEYGQTGGGFTDEGELPAEDGSIYTRRAQYVKYMGKTRSVSHPMQLVNTMIGSVIQQEINNGTLALLRDADEALFFADELVVPQEWNGVLTQHKNAFSSLDLWQDSEVVIDMRGQSLSEAAVEQAALVCVDNFAAPDFLMAPPQILSTFATSFHESKLIQPGIGNIDAVVGQRNKSFMSQFGPIEMTYDKFYKKSRAKYMNAAASNANSPTAPVADAAAAKVAAAEAGAYKFTGAAEAGDYYYAVSAINKYGESVLVDLSLPGNLGAKVTVAAGDSVSLKWAAGAGGTTVTGYKIYRSLKNPTGAIADTPMYPIARISIAEKAAGFDGAAAGLAKDKNRILPGCDEAFVCQNDIEVYTFKQLAPLMKMDLATLAPATRFMLLLYGTPMMYARKKLVRIINVGPVYGSAFL